jgi:hypothetical protein
LALGLFCFSEEFVSNKDLQQTIMDTIGRYSTDIHSGWEAGMQGKKRIAGKLFDHHPPEHLHGPRRDDWYVGYSTALKNRPLRQTHLIGDIPGGDTIKIVRKGWVSWTPIVTRLEGMGVRGDVYVAYTENGNIKRTVNAGI